MYREMSEHFEGWLGLGRTPASERPTLILRTSAIPSPRHGGPRVMGSSFFSASRQRHRHEMVDTNSTVALVKAGMGHHAFCGSSGHNQSSYRTLHDCQTPLLITMYSTTSICPSICSLKSIPGRRCHIISGLWTKDQSDLVSGAQLERQQF
jgi:hypothetical protein